MIQGNTSNIVFLKSTDDAMLKDLSGMSGTRHVVHVNNITVNEKPALVRWFKAEPSTAVSYNIVEEPVIMYNDMAFIGPCNSIVFRAGDSPIWNKNQLALPMSWRLFSNTIEQPGKKYTLQTIPTLSTAMDFDVRKNQPNFQKMLEKRMSQAYIAKEAQDNYMKAYGYSDFDFEQLDPDVVSDEIMDLICSTINPPEVKEAIARTADSSDNDDYTEMFDYMFGSNRDYGVEIKAEDNKEQLEMNAKLAAEAAKADVKLYAGKTLASSDLNGHMGVSHAFDIALIHTYIALRDKLMEDTDFFTPTDKGLVGKDGKAFIKDLTDQTNIEDLNKAVQDPKLRTYSDGKISEEDLREMGNYVVTDDFIKFLAKFRKAWPFADGEFDRRMHAEIMGENDQEPVGESA